ncbi:MAG TPA: 4-(cytidine 5'-diphospho)-2-C-methyl-D-erythritol kinase [Bacteroidales bacterium]|nr:4-(cytidine 5'-diphospho)-2-C-methyl-D-erythritol kinase [Bacteroidales bacterium]
MIFYSPAKINIGLHVLKKRDDGFHDISTFMLPIPFYDIIEITENPSESFSLSTTGIDIQVSRNENLVTKSYKIFPWKNKSHNIHIHLHKQIPPGSGLGGGSSNAATILKALNAFSESKMNDENLKSLASSLGSDCSLFIKNKPCIAKGKGEILTPLDLKLERYFLVLLNPGINVSTADAYRSVIPVSERTPLEQLLRQPIEKWKGVIKNDFETGIFNTFPEIKALKEALYKSGAIYASMSGSGSSVYGIFKNKPSLSKKLKSNLIWEGVISGV